MTSLSYPIIAQEVDSTRSFSIDAEYRPRGEFRYGYTQMRSDSLTPGMAISHRARLNLNYTSNKIDFRFSIQDIRIWGEEDTRNTIGFLQLYEVYVEPRLSERTSLRIGRQRITYDNERLFAENNWRQTGGKHDAVRFIYKSKNQNFRMELTGAYNQNQQALYGDEYGPDFDFYKMLGLHYLQWKISDKLIFSSINFTDGYQDTTKTGVVNYKYTAGGRLKYFPSKSWKIDVAGYYQGGHLRRGQDHSAYLLDASVLKDFGGYNIEVGSQILSGTENINPDGTSRSFLAQYGAFHAYNGRMDYTAAQVSTPFHHGIIDLFVNQEYHLTRTFSARLESHVFFSEANQFYVIDGRQQAIDDFWGYENDLRLTYKPNDFTSIELAYMNYVPTETLEYLQGQGDSDLLQHFAYLEVTFTPKLFEWTKPTDKQ